MCNFRHSLDFFRPKRNEGKGGKNTISPPWPYLPLGGGITQILILRSSVISSVEQWQKLILEMISPSRTGFTINTDHRYKFPHSIFTTVKIEWTNLNHCQEGITCERTNHNFNPQINPKKAPRFTPITSTSPFPSLKLRTCTSSHFFLPFDWLPRKEQKSSRGAAGRA